MTSTSSTSTSSTSTHYFVSSAPLSGGAQSQLPGSPLLPDAPHQNIKIKRLTSNSTSTTPVIVKARLSRAPSDLAASFSSLSITHSVTDSKKDNKETKEEKKRMYSVDDDFPTGTPTALAIDDMISFPDLSLSLSFTPSFGHMDVVPPNTIKVMEQRLAGSTKAQLSLEEIQRYYDDLDKSLRGDSTPVTYEKDGGTFTTTIANMIRQFEAAHPSLVQMWKEGKGWKGDIASEDLKAAPPSDLKSKFLKDELQNARIAAISMVAQIADNLALKFGIPKSNFEDNGTFSIFSDVDLSATCNSESFRDNAVQGIKVGIANAVWRALFKHHAGHLADCNFYHPPIGKYLNFEITDTRAKQLFSYASFMGSLLQMRLHAPPDQAKIYIDRLRATLSARARRENALSEEEAACCTETLRSLDACLADIEKFERTRAAMKNGIPDRAKADILADFVIMQFSHVLAEIGGQIDALERGPKKDLLIAQYYYYAILRELFLPDGYCTKGAFDVICKDRGGQAHQKLHMELEKNQEERTLDAESEKFKESSTQALRDAMSETLAFLAGKDELIGLAKNGARLSKAANALIQQMKAINNLRIAQEEAQRATSGLKSPTELHKKLLAWGTTLNGLAINENEQFKRMDVFLATKRHDWDEGSLIKAFREPFVAHSAARFQTACSAIQKPETKKAILNGDNINLIPGAFMNQFRELFGMDMKYAAKFFSHESIARRLASNPASELASFLKPCGKETSGIDSKVAPSPTTGSSRSPKLEPSRKEELWNLLMNELIRENADFQNESMRALDRLAITIFRQSSPGDHAGFQPKHEMRMNAGQLRGELQVIYCGEMSNTPLEKELFLLAESALKTGKIVSTSSSSSSSSTSHGPAGYEAYAQKELAKIKALLKITTTDRRASDKELLNFMKGNCMAYHGEIDAYCFATGLVATPVKPGEMPSFAVALADLEAVRKYFRFDEVTPLKAPSQPSPNHAEKLRTAKARIRNTISRISFSQSMQVAVSDPFELMASPRRVLDSTRVTRVDSQVQSNGPYTPHVTAFSDPALRQSSHPLAPPSGSGGSSGLPKTSPRTASTTSSSTQQVKGLISPPPLPRPLDTSSGSGSGGSSTSAGSSSSSHTPSSSRSRGTVGMRPRPSTARSTMRATASKVSHSARAEKPSAPPIPPKRRPKVEALFEKTVKAGSSTPRETPKPSHSRHPSIRLTSHSRQLSSPRSGRQESPKTVSIKPGSTRPGSAKLSFGAGKSSMLAKGK